MVWPVFALVSAVGIACADVVEYEDFDEWHAVAGEHTLIDFTEYGHGTILMDEYAHLGVTFSSPGVLVLESGAFPPDGHGITGAEETELVFDGPRSSFGVTFPGTIVFDLYLGVEVVSLNHIYLSDGAGSFAGLVSDEPFDTVVLRSFSTGAQPFIGDLYFGQPVPGPGAWAIGVAAMMGIGSGRRRRR